MVSQLRVEVVTTDQVENLSIIPGWSEKRLCVPIAENAVADLKARGHLAWSYDPRKTWLLSAQLALHRPDVVVFVHVNGSASTRPMRLLGVDCSHAPNRAWSEGVIKAMSAVMPLFSYGGVSTDWALRGFCFWFFKRLRGYPPGSKVQLYPAYKGKRLVLEMGNMRNLQQATYLRDHPAAVGQAISRAIAPDSYVPAPPLPVRPLLRYEATAAQPEVTIKTDRAGNRYYVDVATDGPVHRLQHRLNTHYDGKHGHPALPALVVDGWYGVNTAVRVRRVQKDHWWLGLPLRETGETDTRTWGKVLSF